MRRSRGGPDRCCRSGKDADSGRAGAEAPRHAPGRQPRRSVLGRRRAGAAPAPQPEQYAVSRLERDAEGRWVFNVSMSYAAQQHTMPVPVTIEWAGDTPMITMTEQTIPGLGTFSARVLLYDGLYAGTWKHGQFGGHMWGKIEPAARSRRRFRRPRPAARLSGLARPQPPAAGFCSISIGRSTAPTGSRLVVPSGQITSIASTRSSLPSPNVTGSSTCDR